MSGRYALIIGNTEYIDPGLAQLRAPGKDAEDFGRVLKDQEIAAFDSVNVLVNEPSTSVIEAIDEFFDQKKPDDLLVLYFSGHGVKDEIGSLYLAFKNTIRSRLRSTAIKSDYIREAMDQSRSKRQVVILDCCNSGAFPPGTKAELGGSMGMTQAFQGYGRFVLTASDATQFAWEGDKVIGQTDNSLFTHFLVKGLQGEADSDGDGRITVDELYDYAYQQISKVTPKQTPTKSASKQEGEIVLRQNMRIEDIKPMPLPDDLITEMEDIRPYVREEAVKKLEKITKGKNIGMARSAIDALEKIAADENTTRRVAQAATQVLDAFRQLERKIEEERRAREEEERQAILKAEKERLAREKAEADRKAKEETEKLLRAQAEREAAEREAARLKAEREAAEAAARESAEKAAKEKAEREAVERAATIKAEHDAMELAARKKTERETAERAEREAIELAARRKAEREAAGAQKPKKTTKSSASSFLRWGIIGAIALCGIAGGAWGISYFNTLDGSAPIQTPVPATIGVAATTNVPVDPPTNGEPIEITLWHAYGTGSAEETALSILIDNAAVDLPQYKINVLQVPFGDIFNKYRTDVAAGGGPDMFIVPNDSLGDDARAGLIADITTLAEGKLDGFNELALDGMSLDGKLYGIPESLKAVALWYNKELLPTPPATTNELKALMEDGKYVAVTYGCYHHYGFFKAFGGDIYNENWRVVADEGTGVVDAMTYLNDLYQISRANSWSTTDIDGLAPFTEGQAVAIINGNWAMGDYYAALGDKLAVAPLPAGPAGPAEPLLGVDGFYFNPNSTNQGAALDVALYMTNPKSQTVMMNEAGHVPVQSMIITDPIIQGLVRAFKTATVRPQVPELGKYWVNFCDTDQVFEAGVAPADWVKTAAEAANK